MTIPIHQQNGQDCGSENGSHVVQKPEPMGTVIRSAIQRWSGDLDVTTRRLVCDAWLVGAGAGFSFRMRPAVCSNDHWRAALPRIASAGGQSGRRWADAAHVEILTARRGGQRRSCEECTACWIAVTAAVPMPQEARRRVHLLLPVIAGSGSPAVARSGVRGPVTERNAGRYVWGPASTKWP